MESHKVSRNGKVACAPFVSKSVEAKVKGGFATAENKSGLTQLAVVFPFTDNNGVVYAPPDTVFVKSDGFLTYGKAEYEVDGKRFILVPLDSIHLHEVADRSQ